MKTCQLCSSKRLTPIIDLGMHPLADYFVVEAQLASPEKRYPLVVLLCEDCGHAMLSEQVPPEERYQSHDYSYTASNSKASVEHFEELAAAGIAYAGAAAGDLAVDIGSNDGTLLLSCREQAGMDVQGVDPSANIVAFAESRGVPTEQTFFSAEVAQRLARKAKAKLIFSTNTFNHIIDMRSFMKGVGALLRDDGIFIFEVPYFLDLVKRRAFDTIYLEHIFYFSVTPFKRYFEQSGFYIQELKRTEYMGGSIRVHVGKRPPAGDPCASYIEEEKAAGLHATHTYAAFMQDVQKLKVGLLQEIADIKARGGRIVGIGAATKGNTLLNYCGIDAKMLDFITDSSPLKIGKYTPGTRIPIRPDSAITEEITHALILPWNIADLLKKKLARPGLSFIIPHL